MHVSKFHLNICAFLLRSVAFNLLQKSIFCTEWKRMKRFIGTKGSETSLRHLYHSFQNSVIAEETERIMEKKDVEQYLLGLIWLLHSWNYCNCGSLHKIGPVNLYSWMVFGAHGDHLPGDLLMIGRWMLREEELFGSVV